MTDLQTPPSEVSLASPERSVDTTNTLFHSPAWHDAVEEAFGLTIATFEPPSEPSGAAWYSVVDDIRGKRVVGIPFSDFCEPRIATAQGWSEYTQHLRGYECPVTLRPFVNSQALTDHSFEHVGGLVWHGIDIRAGAEDLFERVSTKVRTKIRRPEKQGVTFRLSSAPEDIAHMHKMHVELRKNKYSMLAQPKRFFEALSANFGEDMVVCFAELDGEPIAGMTFFAWNDVWYYKFSASKLGSIRPNPALMMFAIRRGADRNLGWVDMGRSDDGQAGLLDFKGQFRPEMKSLTTLRWSPENFDNPQGNATGAMLGQLTDLLTESEVPNATTTAAGDLLYKYFA